MIKIASQGGYQLDISSDMYQYTKDLLEKVGQLECGIPFNWYSDQLEWRMGDEDFVAFFDIPKPAWFVYESVVVLITAAMLQSDKVNKES